MVPDFRFVFGATLAIATLGVASFGLVMSARLLHDARVSPLDAAQTLAYAGHAEWNQFYDPDGARRFMETVVKTNDPGAPARLESPGEPLAAVAPAVPEEQTASIPAARVEASVAADQTADADPTRPVEAAPAEPAAPAADPSEPIGNSTTPAAPGRVASAPAVSPASGVGENEETAEQPQAAGNPARAAVPPTPRARPKPPSRVRIAQARVARPVPGEQQTFQSSGFPTTNSQWPSYGGQSTTGAAGAKKSNSSAR